MQEAGDGRWEMGGSSLELGDESGSLFFVVQCVQCPGFYLRRAGLVAPKAAMWGS
jgi:hypothetical protein